MNKYILILLSLFFAGCQNQIPVDPVQQLARLDGLKSPLVVVVKDPRSNRRKLGLGGTGYQVRLDYRQDPTISRYTRRIAQDYGVEVLSEWPLQSLDVICFVIEEPSRADLAKLEADPRVEWVQPYNSFQVQSARSVDSGFGFNFIEQFRHDVMVSARDVRVAIIDTGADTSHPSLANGDIEYLDFVPTIGRGVEEKHGTAVLGLIAADPNLGRYGGLASDATVTLLRACWQEDDGEGRCNTLTLAIALEAAAQFQPDILNLSLTGPKDRVLDALIRRVASKGTLITAAYDEKRNVDERFPSPTEGVVYAYGVKDLGAELVAGKVLHAPYHALSIAPMDKFGLVSGHSVATPQISAMAARLMNQYPQYEREDIVAALRHWIHNNYLSAISATAANNKLD